jgi:hypothetical protein
VKKGYENTKMKKENEQNGGREYRKEQNEKGRKTRS